MTRLLFIIAMTLSTTVFSAQNSTFFRYINDQGVRVIADSIPPEYTVKGYDIIDSQGQIIKTIPPELNQKEKALRIKQNAEKRRMAEWDKELLARYSTIDDIKATKKRRLKGVDNSIFSLRLTLNNISETIKHYQAEAAANERQGETVSKDTLSSITRLQKDRVFIEDEIKRKKKRREEVATNYDKDIDRFRIIKPAKK